MDGFLDKLHAAWAILTSRSFLIITDEYNTARIKSIYLDSMLEQLELAQDAVEQFKQDAQLKNMKRQREEQGRE